MNKGGKFSAHEGILFVSTVIVSKILYTSTPAVVQQAGTAAWYSTLVSCVTTIIAFLLMCKLLDRFPSSTLAKIFEIVLGKVVGKIMAVMLSTYIFFYAASNLREFLEMIKAYNLPNTPPSVIMLTFIAVCSFIVYKGIESVVRIAYINSYVIISALAVILLLAIPYYDIAYIKPYLGYGIRETLTLGIFRSSAYEEVTLVLMINRSFHNKDYKKVGIASIITAGVIFSVSFLCYLMADGYNMGGENLSGIFQLTRIIYFNRYFQRVESIFLFAWVISALITVATAFFIAVKVYCQCFDIEDHKPIIFPFAMIIYVLALQPKNISELIDINLKIVRQYSFILTYSVPIITLLLSIIMGKKETNANV